MKIKVKNYIPEYITQLIEVQKKYKRRYPNYSIRGEEIYTKNPGFENGKNIFCAFDNDGLLLAYAPIVAAPVKDDAPIEYCHYIWTDIIFNPELEELDLVRNALLNSVLQRAFEIKAVLSERKTRLAVIKYSNEKDGIDYFIQKGFENYETYYTMSRDLTKAIPEIPAPDEICVKKWNIETLEDKLKYVNTDNLSNPNNPISLDKLEWYLKTLWSVGAPIGAFDKNGELLGSVMTYWFSETDAVTEEIFVLPQWRRKGIAQYLVKEALSYLKACGKLKAELEVRKSNEIAVKLYTKMGYDIDIEEYSLGFYL